MLIFSMVMMHLFVEYSYWTTEKQKNETYTSLICLFIRELNASNLNIVCMGHMIYVALTHTDTQYKKKSSLYIDKAIAFTHIEDGKRKFRLVIMIKNNEPY